MGFNVELLERLKGGISFLGKHCWRRATPVAGKEERSRGKQWSDVCFPIAAIDGRTLAEETVGSREDDGGGRCRWWRGR
ncbi:unnamed protein product [Lactuca virosa]|uniref:Uncharacterized protein n=1 Tax=Lactuca virosa TaxID=75947 RepID=A0AAU9NGQ7_9ASTR|nr:unnamed protein product [Lactuca virosa]